MGGGVLVVAAIAWLNRPRDEPAKATVREAVRSFRAGEETAGQKGRSGEPALGVYRYATRGAESTKSPLFGATHDYDGVSTVALSKGQCGTIERWRVLTGRWSEVEVCSRRGGDTFATVVEFHEFFETGQKDTFRCRGPDASELTSLGEGARFSSTCESEDTTISTVSRVVGSQEVEVGGESFDATRVKSRSVLDGDTSGTARREEWRRRSDGLLLRRSTESEADTSIAGGTHYSEHYTIRLLSIRPKR